MATGKEHELSGAALLAAEPVQSQELVMTLLGSYVRPHHELVWSGGLVQLLTELGFSTGAARVAMTRLAQRNLIARVRRGRLVHYRLTDRAEMLLAEGDRRIFSLGLDVPPARVWTVLWHDIPEARRLERSRLAKRLRFLGFGTLQDGLWISPHDRTQEVSPILGDLEILAHAGLVVGETGGALGPEPLVRTAWDTRALSERYHAFVEMFSRYATRKRVTDREAFAIRTQMVHVFRGFALLDPNLPDELMPDAKIRARAVAVFQRAYKALDEPAQRHFDEVASGWRKAQPSGAEPVAADARRRTRADRPHGRSPR